MRNIALSFLLERRCEKERNPKALNYFRPGILVKKLTEEVERRKLTPRFCPPNVLSILQQ
jgi:hypothetical protein